MSGAPVFGSSRATGAVGYEAQESESLTSNFQRAGSGINRRARSRLKTQLAFQGPLGTKYYFLNRKHFGSFGVW